MHEVNISTKPGDHMAAAMANSLLHLPHNNAAADPIVERSDRWLLVIGTGKNKAGGPHSEWIDYIVD